MRTMLKSKIHRARITGSDLEYEGSITIDKNLMQAADILPYEQVQVLDINNGSRFATYVIEGIAGGHEHLKGCGCRECVFITPGYGPANYRWQQGPGPLMSNFST